MAKEGVNVGILLNISGHINARVVILGTQTQGVNKDPFKNNFYCKIFYGKTFYMANILAGNISCFLFQAVFAVNSESGLTLTEIGEDVAIEEIITSTGCEFEVAPDLKKMGQINV